MRSPKHAVPAHPSVANHAVRAIAALIGLALVVGLAAIERPASRVFAEAGGVLMPAPGALRLPFPGEDLRVAERREIPTLTSAAVMPRLTAKPKAAPHPAPKAAKPPTRWLPSGTGMWLHDWSRSSGGNARQVVDRARKNGITTLYVRSWSKKGGYEAPRVLRSLLPATKHSNVKVVVWEFVQLKNPVGEARRLAAAAKITVKGAPRVAAVAPDIETAAEGTQLNGARVLVYMQALRAALPRDVAILATVPWPSEFRIGKFPYAAVARYANAILPMTYWYNRSPVTVTAASVRFLRRYHRPIMPVGQGYDGRIDAPWLPRANVAAEVGAFLSTAKKIKLPAVSLWSWQTVSPPVWAKLSRARNAYTQ